MDSKNIQPAKSLKESSSSSLKVGFVLAAMVATVLFSMPLSPRFPKIGLDPSWMYALNEAVARHLVFGRDVVFTYGPLASVCTKMFHPATDWISHASIAGFPRPYLPLSRAGRDNASPVWTDRSQDCLLRIFREIPRPESIRSEG